ncbi:hypothetical protein [Nocardia brasiliensis]|uniref:hypothetical protein n=1 Tax=Nocardia brasiliensis TaxID=37326 RepID=UPI00189476F0|nr:hypothetical protein [Nocardia brasiliensis]MBF6548850.1 hypothetical protein [Nocardia brasiliensis]
MNMNWNRRVVPDEVTTDDVMALFGWSRSEVSRRRRSGDLPEPDPWRGSERKPRWSRRAIMDALARLGRLDGVVLAAFEGSADSPVRWGKALSDNEYVQLPEMAVRGELQRTHLYRVVRYLRRDEGPAYADTPEFQLSLCLAIDDPNPQRVFNALLVRSEVAHALGYGTGEAGTIAVILPCEHGDDPQLRFARIPADFPPDHVIELERVPEEQMPIAAHLLGHPLPVWTPQEITATGIAKWEPHDWAPERWNAEGNPTPVELAVPRELTQAQAFRRSVDAVLERIGSGQITAPAEVPDSLRGLVYRAWEAPLMNMRRRDPIPAGWAWLFELPAWPTQGWPQDDVGPGLRWLASSPHAPAEAAKFATRYFGYDASVAAAVIDLNRFTPDTRAAIRAALVPIEAGTAFLHTELERELAEHQITGPRQHYRWAADPDPDSHPVIVVGDTLALHIPRVQFPLATPTYVEVATSATRRTTYIGVVADVDGNISPMPIRPHDEDSAASALTAAVWAPTAELFAGGRNVIGNVPADIRRLLKLLGTGQPLHLDWAELSAATGPGPGPHADWQQLYTWRQGDPPIEPS